MGGLQGCWGLEVVFEVTEAKLSKSSSFLSFFKIEFSSFWILRSFDLGDLGSVDIFNDYIFEISLFNWSKCAIECAICLSLISKSAQARCAVITLEQYRDRTGTTQTKIEWYVLPDVIARMTEIAILITLLSKSFGILACLFVVVDSFVEKNIYMDSKLFVYLDSTTVFNVYLMRGLQKCAINGFLTM